MIDVYSNDHGFIGDSLRSGDSPEGESQFDTHLLGNFGGH